MSGRAFLWVGLAGGVALTIAGLARRPDAGGEAAAPEGAAAVVGERTISADRYWGALAALAAQEKGPELDAARRRRVLDELIAEELLVGRAMELDLPASDPLVRKQLLRAMVDLITSEADSAEPDEAELREFFDENQRAFSVREELAVDVMYFRGDVEAARERAEAARARVERGEDFDAVADEAADAPPVPVPPGLLDKKTLASYVGPTAARKVSELEPGKLAGPIRVSGGWRVLRLRDRRTSEEPRFRYEDVRKATLALWRRKRRGGLLEAYVNDLRDSTEITVNQALLDAGADVPESFLEAARVGAGQR